MSLLTAQLLLGISGNATKIVLISIFTLGVVLVILIPLTIDTINAHISWRKALDKQPDCVCAKSPGGVQGLARATMALALIAIISFGLVYLLVQHPFGDKDSTIVSNILVALTTALASVTAFYFGARAADARQASGDGTAPAGAGTPVAGDGGVGGQPSAEPVAGGAEEAAAQPATETAPAPGPEPIAQPEPIVDQSEPIVEAAPEPEQ